MPAKDYQNRPWFYKVNPHKQTSSAMNHAQFHTQITVICCQEQFTAAFYFTKLLQK